MVVAGLESSSSGRAAWLPWKHRSIPLVAGQGRCLGASLLLEQDKAMFPTRTGVLLLSSPSTPWEVCKKGRELEKVSLQSYKLRCVAKIFNLFSKNNTKIYDSLQNNIASFTSKV